METDQHFKNKARGSLFLSHHRFIIKPFSMARNNVGQIKEEKG